MEGTMTRDEATDKNLILDKIDFMRKTQGYDTDGILAVIIQQTNEATKDVERDMKAAFDFSADLANVVVELRDAVRVLELEVFGFGKPRVIKQSREPEYDFNGFGYVKRDS
jgi:hypothetical protein